ncbi:LPXTG cell wall anchor domain-containing protein [Lactococcus garvieae]|uniref:LPXTG cell wall anchor domain-containing protein n=1 Tax=Lactococcus garvieae TaxID=1363 RepID=UPI0009B60AC7
MVSQRAEVFQSERLPKTGQESSLSFNILGLSFILIGVGTWYFKRRGKDNHV